MTTGGIKVKTDDKKKARLAKLAVGAASVMVGTGLYAGHAMNVKADSAENTSPENHSAEENTNQQQGMRAATSVQPKAPTNQANGQAIQAASNDMQSGQKQTPAVQATTNDQQTGQEIDDHNYEADNLNVTTVNGYNADTHGYIVLTTQLRIKDAKKIHNGDYLDFKLGAPTTDGKLVDYSSSLLPNQDITLTDQYGKTTKVGEIQQEDQGENTAYYRLVFNDQLQSFLSPTINLQLIWKSMIQSGVMLRLYTQKEGYPDHANLMNDLQIGTDTNTSWSVPVPVIYVPSSGKTQQPYNLIQAGYGAEHIWTTDDDGTEHLQAHGMDETVNVWLADKLSNTFTVTVQGLADQPYFETYYYTGEQVAEQIENAIKQQHQTSGLGTKIAGRPELSLGVVSLDDGSQIPKVTVTRTTGKSENGYNTEIYQIVIDTDQQVSTGTTPIVFARITNKKGVIPYPASTIKTYKEDQQSVAASSQRVIYGGGYETSGTYRGPKLANQELQKFMSTRHAAYVAIHDDANSSNNNGYLGNVPYYNPVDPRADLASVNFVFNIAQQNAANVNNKQNTASGLAQLTGSEKVEDYKTITQTIHYQFADGSQARPDHVATVQFTRTGIRNILNNTTIWNAWQLKTPSQLSNNGHWPDVTSPTIQGYTPSQKVVSDNSQLSADSSNVGVTVVYTKNVETGQVSVNFVDQDDLQNLADAGYVLSAGDPTQGQEVKIDGQTQTITINLKHSTKSIQEQKQVTRTIHYQDVDGKQLADDAIQSVSFSRTGQQDEVTGLQNWGNWQTTGNPRWDAVTSPTIKGYTALTATVPAKQVDVKDPNVYVTVAYSKQGVPVKMGTATVNFIDVDDNNRLLLSKQLSGQVGSDTHYTTKNDLAGFSNNVLDNDQTQGKSVVITDSQQTYQVYLKHASKSINDSKTIKETIHYQFADGTPAQADHVATIKFSRQGVHDQVTGNDRWDPWTSSSTFFAAVDSPVIDGYTANPEIVEARNINSDSPDEEVTVTYLKKASNQGHSQTGPQTDNHQQTPQSSNPGQTQPSKQAEDGQAANPSTETVVSDQSGVNGPVVQTNGQAPSGYKWETIRVLVPNSPANQQRLPQTGNAQGQMGAAFALIAAILGIFGLSWPGLKKDQDN